MPSGPIADTGVDQTSADPGFPFFFSLSFLLCKPAPQYHRQCGTSHFCTAEDIELHPQRAPGCRYSPVGRYKALLCHWRCHHELSPVSHIHHVKLSARVRLSSPSAARAPRLVFSPLSLKIKPKDVRVSKKATRFTSASNRCVKLNGEYTCARVCGCLKALRVDNRRVFIRLCTQRAAPLVRRRPCVCG